MLFSMFMLYTYYVFVCFFQFIDFYSRRFLYALRNILLENIENSPVHRNLFLFKEHDLRLRDKVLFENE